MRPFEGANYNAIIVATATHEPKNIDHVAPSLPQSVRVMIRACLERNPKKRPPTFEHVMRLLDVAMPDLTAWRGMVAFAGKTGLLTPTPTFQPLPFVAEYENHSRSGVLTLHDVRRRRWVYASVAVGVAAILTGGLIGRWAAHNVGAARAAAGVGAAMPARPNLVYVKTQGVTFVHDTHAQHPTMRVDTLPLDPR